MTVYLDLFLAMLAAFGFWWIIGRSSISLGVRTFVAGRWPWPVELVECPGCFGFWEGVIAGSVIGVQSSMTVLSTIAVALLGGCMGSASNLILFSIASSGIRLLEEPPMPPMPPTKE